MRFRPFTTSHVYYYICADGSYFRQIKSAFLGKVRLKTILWSLAMRSSNPCIISRKKNSDMLGTWIIWLSCTLNSLAEINIPCSNNSQAWFDLRSGVKPGESWRGRKGGGGGCISVTKSIHYKIITYWVIYIRAITVLCIQF